MQPPPPVTRALLIATTVLIFLAQIPSLRYMQATWLILSPLDSGLFWPWQVLTYSFVHADAIQWIFNMLGLYLFGSQLERLWGTRRYVQFLLASGLAAAAVFLALALFFPAVPLVGSSSWLFGMLLAFGVLFPQQRIMLYFVADVTMRTAVLVFFGIEVFMMLGSVAAASGRWVADLAQLAGAGGAWLMILWWRHRPPPLRRRAKPPVRRVH
jgi:membrane associated rhomboid family serine protease